MEQRLRVINARVLEVGQGWLGFIIPARLIMEANLALRGACYLILEEYEVVTFTRPSLTQTLKIGTNIITL